MSFARFGWEDSDVYIFLNVAGHFECCYCGISDQCKYYSTDEMITHLREHLAAGQTVPEDTFTRLEAERVENDEFVKTARNF